MKYGWIQAHQGAFELTEMCKALGVSRSGYYAWHGRGISARERRRRELAMQIAVAHEQSRRTYGSPRVYRELRAKGEKVCENTVAAIMRAEGLRAKKARRFVPQTTDTRHDFPVAENLLQQDFRAEKPNRKWVSDITYIRTGEGWLYVAAILDLYSRKVVGWSMNDEMHTRLVTEAFRMALARRAPESGLLHHSDRGVQYASAEYQELLKEAQCICSMSRTGNCYDNAAMESFWGTLKQELVYRREFATREEARAAIFEYIEVFYNRQRRHSALGYISPESFEAALN
jgi:transposase InsO family protein